ncbi:alginate lyase family protein [Nocardioides guangzhouensis]|uniref:Alginate lyase family protein n=1 Tax=Nocardioides guangzhouensis TaxID=2497878 RepID=A0A4Q4ZC64_9ACTN|nr:alginate lyase family protein [Nocardioides guangzhouensis]RYP85553.1 alginate lyase family protein [Nocardioides guangzhouensis]
MSPAEIASRTADEARRRAWARRQVLPGADPGPVPRLRDERRFTTVIPSGTQELVPPAARAAAVAAADRVLTGEWLLLGTPRPDIADPDWFRDPVTGRRAPQRTLAFRVDHRDEAVTGNVKSVWELSRHHHLTVLAAGWWLTGDARYAEAVDRQLRSWWDANPFLSGIHWTSGIELGVRLTAWAWARRLLDGWAGAADLFEQNPVALHQIRWHQEYLDAFRSTGSSANNHVVAEAVGRVAGACAFPWFAESSRWRADAAAQLHRELHANTFPSGVNRELATDYHRFVTELGVVAGAEAAAAGHPLSAGTWSLLGRSFDAAAALTDAAGNPPRQGDGDEGRALVLDDPEAAAWGQMLALGDGVVGSLPWWPERRTGTVASTVVPALLGGRVRVPGRPVAAPRVFDDAGITLLRTAPEEGSEVWCRCDAGPHGFLSIAAHGHADALAVEVRHGGVEVLVDPGTYCYHGEPEWRSYFRSTVAHNTLEVDGQSQAVEGGPFLWSTQPHSEVLASEVDPAADRLCWTARHDGYARLGVAHRRTVTLDRATRGLTLTDVVEGESRHHVRLALHLGPEVAVELRGATALLSWEGPDGPMTATMTLPAALRWSAHRGETAPVLGWYSPRFGERVPTTTLLGNGSLEGRLELRTALVFEGSTIRGRTYAKVAGGVRRD